MSSPIARTPSPASSRSSSGSPTGVYVPIHKRKASDPSVRMASHVGSAAAATLAGRPSDMERQQPSFVYQASQLRALASSPLVPASLTPAQRARLAAFSALVPARPAASAEKPAAGQRRRRAGRRASNAKKLQAEVHVDVESRRRRHGHGTWGWAAHAGELEREESWRHPDAHALPAPVAVRA